MYHAEQVQIKMISQTYLFKWSFYTTVECSYNVVQYNMIISLTTALYNAEYKSDFRFTKGTP